MSHDSLSLLFGEPVRHTSQTRRPLEPAMELSEGAALVPVKSAPETYERPVRRHLRLVGPDERSEPTKSAPRPELYEVPADTDAPALSATGTESADELFAELATLDSNDPRRFEVRDR